MQSRKRGGMRVNHFTSRWAKKNTKVIMVETVTLLYALSIFQDARKYITPLVKVMSKKADNKDENRRKRIILTSCFLFLIFISFSIARWTDYNIQIGNMLFNVGYILLFLILLICDRW